MRKTVLIPGASRAIGAACAQLGAAGEYVDYAASRAALDVLTIGLAKKRRTRASA